MVRFIHILFSIETYHFTGNHELYVSEVAYDTFSNFSKVWGDKYITSNVQIINPATGQFEFVGSPYRYFTTDHGTFNSRKFLGTYKLISTGYNIMAFGVLYDFTGNSNVSKVIKAKDLVQQSWFLDAINTKDPVDVVVLLGHNPVRPTDYSSTFKTVYKAIRAARPDTPIQILGGHSHIRDFAVYDDITTGLESGKQQLN